MATIKRYVYSEIQGNKQDDTLAQGTLIVDDNNQLRLHDGSTAGGLVIPSNFATVASSGSYTDLTNTPQNPVAFMSSYGSANDLQFLRYVHNTGTVEFADDFRVVDGANVSYPNGYLTDKLGDVAFTADGILYCLQQPNSFEISINSSAGYVNQGWITVASTPSTIQLGYKFTDGTTTADVVEIIQAYNGNFGVYRIDPVVPSWYGGVPSTLTVVTSGSTPNVGNWKKLSTNYTPDNSAHWAAPAPTTLGEALDRLAAAVYTLNSNTPI